MHIHIPPDHPVHILFDHMHMAGHDIRIVGGFVRDMLIQDMAMGNTDTAYDIDVDMATPALPQIVQQVFENAGYKVLPIGIQHGTVRVVVPYGTAHKVFEITTLRQDVQTDGRHAIVTFTDNWKADAKRRDLTINSLYADKDGTVYDYCNGIRDIAHKKIRFIGDVQTRIREDTLRIIRFWRFVVKTGWTYDESVCDVFQNIAPKIRHLSRERIRDEMFKMLSYATDPTPVIHTMRHCGVMARIVPFPINRDMPLMSSKVATSTDIYAKVIALCGGNGDYVKTLGGVWMLSNAEKRLLQQTISVFRNRAFVPPMVHRFLYYYGYDTVLRAGMLKNQQLMDVIQSYAPYEKPEFPISGADLIKMGIPQGAKLGGMLKAIESWWVDQQCKPRQQDCLMMAMRLKNKR